ncbi:MAG: RNA pyrophosphohydrolase [Geminicoccaceae bacterium]
MSCHVTAGPKTGYRRCVGMLLLNGDGRIFVGQRKDAGDKGGWQMPQGGIEKGEQPEDAAFREMEEEVGTRLGEILSASRVWRSYDLPAEIASRMWKGAYRGQTQKWVAIRFTGADKDIDIHTEHAEFSRWRWVEPDEIVDLIVPFKRDVYLSVFDEFRHLWAGS